jgi:hypothetical protein
MDPITTAIIAAIVAGATAGVTKIGEQSIVDAYIKLKDLLKQKFGAKSDVAKAIKELEAKPDSKARKEVLAEEVAVARADQDVELLRAAKDLLDIVKKKSSKAQLILNTIGDQNIQVAGDGNIISSSTFVPSHGLKSSKKSR